MIVGLGSLIICSYYDLSKRDQNKKLDSCNQEAIAGYPLTVHLPNLGNWNEA